ncbi:MAG: nucleotide pyrophosphohydrolase [Flavobacteriales bacterium]
MKKPRTSTPITELQTRVDDWIRTIGVRYFDPLTNMALLAEEVGEVARVMARTYGEQSKKKKEQQDLGEELGDVLFVVLCLANQTGTDLQAAFDRKFEKRTKRDAQRHQRNKKLR